MEPLTSLGGFLPDGSDWRLSSLQGFKTHLVHLENHDPVALDVPIALEALQLVRACASLTASWFVRLLWWERFLAGSAEPLVAAISSPCCSLMPQQLMDSRLRFFSSTSLSNHALPFV